MANFVLTIFFTIFIINFVVVFLYFIKLRNLLNYLKEIHTSKWEELGKPTVFMNNSPQNSLNTVRFIWSGNDLGDPTLGKMLQITKNLLIIGVGIFATLNVLLFGMVFLNQ